MNLLFLNWSNVQYECTMLPNLIVSVSTTHKSPLSTQVRRTVGTAWALKSIGTFSPNIGRLFEAEMVTAGDWWLASQRISALHTDQSTGLDTSRDEWKWGRVLPTSGQHPWEGTHLYWNRPKLGLYSRDTNALWNHSTHLAVLTSSVQQPSSPSTSTLSCDIFKLCPQCLNHPILLSPSTPRIWGWEKVQLSLSSKSNWSSGWPGNALYHEESIWLLWIWENPHISQVPISVTFAHHK